MARTKQCARRSAGGYAVRKSFALLPAREPSMPSTPESPNKKRRSTRTAAKITTRTTAGATTKTKVEPPRLTIKVPPLIHDSVSSIFRIVIIVAKITGIQYCCVCSEGGTLYRCNDCRRVACTHCIEFTPNALVLLQQPDVTFICPQSHIDRDRKNAEKQQSEPESTKKSALAPYTVSSTN
jgi:hypothetical protein